MERWKHICHQKRSLSEEAGEVMNGPFIVTGHASSQTQTFARLSDCCGATLEIPACHLGTLKWLKTPCFYQTQWECFGATSFRGVAVLITHSGGSFFSHPAEGQGQCFHSFASQSSDDLPFTPAPASSSSSLDPRPGLDWALNALWLSHFSQTLCSCCFCGSVADPSRLAPVPRTIAPQLK